MNQYATFLLKLPLQPVLVKTTSESHSSRIETFWFQLPAVGMVVTTTPTIRYTGYGKQYCVCVCTHSTLPV